MLRAVAGTAIGFVLGAVLIEFVGVDPVVLWILLPLVAFGSAYVPEVGSFIAGQAAFTMMVLINFNLIAPTGWRVGLVRVEDVVVGATGRDRGVAAVVAARRDSIGVEGDRSGPRGWRAVPEARRSPRDPGRFRDRPPTASSHWATTRFPRPAPSMMLSVNIFRRTAGPAINEPRRYARANRANRVRAAAELIADVVPPPLGVYARTREVIEEHAAAICARLTGDGRHRCAGTDRGELRGVVARRGRRDGSRRFGSPALGDGCRASRRAGVALPAARRVGGLAGQPSGQCGINVVISRGRVPRHSRLRRDRNRWKSNDSIALQ